MLRHRRIIQRMQLRQTCLPCTIRKSLRTSGEARPANSASAGSVSVTSAMPTSGARIGPTWPPSAAANNWCPRQMPRNGRPAPHPPADCVLLGDKPGIPVFLPDIHGAAHYKQRRVPVELRFGVTFVESDGIPGYAVGGHHRAKAAGVLDGNMLKNEDTHNLPRMA